jgi:hypothetical protein
VAFCKATIRTARSDISFKARVADAVQEPLDTLRKDLIKAVGDLLSAHTLNCPMNKPDARATTWKDVVMAGVKNKWFCIAIAVIAFSPNLVAVVQLWKK